MATPEIDISELSESEQLALQQYTAVTDQNLQEAIPLLVRSQWNVQIAIAKFFDGEGPDPVAEALAAQNAPPPRTSIQENLQQSLLNGAARPSRHERQPDAAPRIVPQPDQDIVRRPPLLLAILFTPFNLLYRLLSSSLGLFSFLFPFLPRALRPGAPNGTVLRANTGGRRPLKPTDSAVRLKRELEEEYGNNSLPFYEGGYAQALDLAKRDLKFLLILLLSPEHDDTSSFIRETLLAPEVQTFVNDPAKNIILWTGDIRDSEAYQVSSALVCSKFPFTAVIAHTPSQGSTAMSVIARITGPMDASTYLAKVRTAISSHEDTLATARAARSAQNFERNLRQEQDSAYEKSLQADRERARLKREAEAAAVEEERRKKEEAEAAATLAEKKLQWRRWRASHIEPEPVSETKDVVRIALKMPYAARITRTFKASDNMEELYAFVDCYDLLADASNAADVEEPTNYKHEFDFRLVQTLPRVVYEIGEGGTIGERVGRSGNLIVEPIKIEDEEDEE
ncbi:UBX domain protein [Mollisia scopiformis]|uniref:UBX domain protein n=1 Tax=Mollisia scopiformis TaxID=149040 RepID=A0A194XTJ0_MOLSC|nr:UBX domain protein [Mollisia scopiformis]KUJ23635.1 UBX domain protein [Mollisia scopiformis]